MHLFSGAFKKPSAPAGKEGVATEEDGVLSLRAHHIGDMACRMTGHIQHLNGLPKDPQLLSAPNGHPRLRGLFPSGCVNRPLEKVTEPVDAARMVGMVVRH